MDPRLSSALRWHVSRWFNTSGPLTLEQFQGQVVAVHTFQMLCPGCVAHGLPQAGRLRASFPESELAVVGLHTVFEHHEVMTPEVLKAFIHEYRLPFPIGVDEPDPHGPIPKTMAAWGLQGTPSLVLIDRHGVPRLTHLGRIEDLALGAVIGRLLEEPYAPAPSQDTAAGEGRCEGDVCGAG